MRKKSLIGIVIGIGIVFGMTGCMTTELNQNETSKSLEKVQKVEFADENYDILTDNKGLYEKDDPYSVVTMYLTVSKGSESDYANHTWEEVNSHSAYYYDELGIERYRVNGLLQVGNEEGPTEGSLGYQQVTPNAIVNVRGQTSSKYKQKNYKIELKDGKGKWREQRVINLNKHQMDGLRFRNKLSYDLMKEIPDMFAMRTQFVHLYVKDETTENPDGKFHDYGLYTQVEQTNKTYLTNHGLDKNGHFYKINYFEFYRYEDVIMPKNNANYDEKAFEYRLEIKGNDDHKKLIHLLEKVNDSAIPITEIMEEHFEKNNLLSWMAFHILTGNIDTQSRNTCIYSPGNSEKWYFISWDNDGCFLRKEDEVRGNLLKAGWEHGISNYWGNVLFKRVLKDEGLRKELINKVEEYKKILSEDKLTKMVQDYAAVVKPYAFYGNDKLGEPLTPEEYDEVCEALPKEVEINYQEFYESLSEPMPFFIANPQVTTDRTIFTWEIAYDFEHRDVFYTFELADNVEFKNPIIREEKMFLPEYQYQNKLQPGQYFMRVQALNSAGKEQHAFDYYVSDGRIKHYGVICFYVNKDGSIERDIYDEGK